MLVRFNKRTIVGGSTYEKDSEQDLANDLADQVVRQGNGEVVGLGSVARELQWGAGGVKNPSGGADIPLPASQSLLSVTTVKLAANTVVATAGTIPFDTVVRDDLGLFISAALGIRIPATATQLRFSWDIAYSASTDGTYRKITPRPLVANVGVTLANIGMPSNNIIANPAVALAQTLAHTFCSHLIDVAAMLAAQSLAFAGDVTDRFYLQLGHDATVGSLSVVAGSSMTIEAYTPA